MLAERLGDLSVNVGNSKQVSPECKQCRACCNLDSVLTTGYLSYLNECVALLIYPVDLHEVVFDRVDRRRLGRDKSCRLRATYSLLVGLAVVDPASAYPVGLLLRP